MKRTIKTAVSTTVLCATIAIVSSCFGGGKKSAFDTVTIQKGSITKSVTATGTIEPINQVEVGTQVSGIVDKLYAEKTFALFKEKVNPEVEKVSSKEFIERCK